jgi:hypothetical protein
LPLAFAPLIVIVVVALVASLPRLPDRDHLGDHGDDGDGGRIARAGRQGQRPCKRRSDETQIAATCAATLPDSFTYPARSSARCHGVRRESVIVYDAPVPVREARSPGHDG